MMLLSEQNAMALGKPVAEYVYDSCTSKSRYSSRALAERVARRTMEGQDGQELVREMTLRVYGCSICLGWHLTSRAASKRFTGH